MFQTPYQSSTNLPKENQHVETKDDEFARVMSNFDDVPNLSGNVNDIVNFYCQKLSSAKHAGDKAREGAVYSTLGLFFLGQCDYKKAIEYNDLALDIFKELGDKRQEGYVYHRRGDVFQKLGEFEKAMEYKNRALSIAIDLGEKPLEGYAYYGLGNAFRGLCSYDKAIGFYKRCLSVAKGLSDKTIRWSLESIAYSNLGHAFDFLGDYKRAETYHRLHLSNAKEGRDKSREAAAYRGLGNVFQGLGNFKKAQEYYSLSLSIAKDVRDKEAVGHSYAGLAYASRSLGDTENALKYSNLRLTCAKELGNKYREGDAYCDLGHIYKSLGDFKKSIEYFKRYLEIAKDFGDSEGEGAAYGGLGNAFYSLGDFEKAVYYHNQHLDIAKNIGDKEGEAFAHGNLGNVYLSLGDLKKANYYYLRRLSIAKDLGDKAGEGRAYGHLGRTYQHIGDYHKAMVYNDRCLCIAQELGNKADEGFACSNLGIVSQRIGDYMKAIDWHKQQLRIGKETGDKEMLGIGYYNIGHCFEMLKSLPEALENYQTGIKVLNEMRSLLQSEDQWKIGFRNECNEAYTGLWRVLLKQEKLTEALVAAEEGRAQSLADLIKSQYGLKECQYGGKFLGKENGMLNSTSSSTIFLAVNVFENQVDIWLVSKEKPVLHRKRKLDHHRAENANETLRSLIQFSYENMGVRAKVNCENRSLDAVRKHCSVVEQSFKTCSQPINQEGNLPLATLYSYVIAPILDMIDGYEIIIVPDGPLWLAPFAALRNPSSKYLCESFKVRIIPSLTSLKILAHCPEHHSSSGALIVGDPDVSEVTNSHGDQLEQLPFARQEAQMIGQILNAAPLTGKLATKCEVLKQISSVAVVHIAAHGRMETGEIALSPNPESRKSQTPAEEDYMLTMKDVMSVKLRAKLVVLSCCHSGRGEIKAEGLVGIARAFIGAGARSVLVSLWAIDDEATLEFMKSFYHNLVKGRRASESLNHAMKCLRESETFSDVKYWAPFTLIGDDVTLDKQEEIRVS